MAELIATIRKKAFYSSVAASIWLIGCLPAEAQEAPVARCRTALYREPLPTCTKEAEAALLEKLTRFDLLAEDAPAQLRTILTRLRGCDAKSIHEVMSKWPNLTHLGVYEKYTSTSVAPLNQGHRLQPCDGGKVIFHHWFQIKMPYGPIFSRIFSPRWYQNPSQFLIFRLFQSDTLPILLTIDEQDRLVHERVGRPVYKM